MKKIIAIVLAALLIISLVGCGAEKKEETGENPQTVTEESETKPEENAQEPAADAAEPATAAEPLVLTDMMGREVTIPAVVERVVVITAADCEILYAIGAGDLVVGRGEYCNYPAEVLDIAAVQSGTETNLEQIIALQPQLVLTSAMDQDEDQIKSLMDAGIAVVTSDADSIWQTYESIEMIGKAVHHTDEAAALIQSMKDGFAAVSNVVPEGETKTVYFEVSPLEWGLWTAGKGTFMDEIAAMLGLENIFADVDGWQQVSEEQVLSRNPDYIVTISMYYGEGPTPVEEIMGREGWQSISAIANGNVLNVDSDSLSRPAPRLVEAASELADFVTGK